MANETQEGTSKGVIIGLFVVMALLIGGVVYSKKSSKAEALAMAAEAGKKQSAQVSRVNALLKNNQVIWSAVTDALQSNRSFASVDSIVKAKRLPAKEGEGTPLTVQVVDKAGGKVLSFGWEKYQASFEYDAKGALVKVDVSALMQVDDPALQADSTYISK